VESDHFGIEFEGYAWTQFYSAVAVACHYAAREANDEEIRAEMIARTRPESVSLEQLMLAKN
jgi:hypothetical protein